MEKSSSEEVGELVEHLCFMKFYYTYVLKSKKDGDFYIGWTTDLVGRVKKHENGMVDSTRDRLPLSLVYYEACLHEKKAIAREKYFKTGFGRRFLKNRF